MYINACIHTYKHTYIHTYKHIHIYIYNLDLHQAFNKVMQNYD